MNTETTPGPLSVESIPVQKTMAGTLGSQLANFEGTKIKATTPRTLTPKAPSNAEPAVRVSSEEK